MYNLQWLTTHLYKYPTLYPGVSIATSGNYSIQPAICLQYHSKGPAKTQVGFEMSGECKDRKKQ